MILPPRFYSGPWLWLSVFIVAGIAVAGYFYPLAGLAVPVMMLMALVSNARSGRSFCAGLCPNGRSLSSTLKRLSPGRKLPRFLASREGRRALCGIALFCMISLLSRSDGSISSIGRAFWTVYVAATGIGFLAGLMFKPRSWCAFCPMGTLQDSLKPSRRA